MDECRKEFEKWAVSDGFNVERGGSNYLSQTTFFMWKAWKALWNLRAPVAQLSVDEIYNIARDCGLMYKSVGYYSITRDVSSEEIVNFANAIAARVQPAAGQQSNNEKQQTLTDTCSDENCDELITNMLMNCADMLGRFPKAKINPKAWQHILVYAPAANAAPDVRNQVLEEAPPNSLPNWSECKLRVENSDYIDTRKAEGGYGAEHDTLLASELHRFIYEYDDADKYRSAWFLYRLEKLLNETRANALKTAAPSDGRE